jgi:hypothetical protein
MTRPVPSWYRIRVNDHLDPSWSAWFDDLFIWHDADGTTTLSGPVVDQAALYGLLGRARDLGLTLLSVSPCDPGERNDHIAYRMNIDG